MGLLESDPTLLTSYAEMALRFADDFDYIAPVNVLWTYYFINDQHDNARLVWDRYIKDSQQIMFQKVCQVARTQCNLDMAKRLVSLLAEEANVTPGAQGIAYSCLLDVMAKQGDYRGALGELRHGLNHYGFALEDVNRTALLRLKAGLEESGLEFPLEVPKKNPSAAASVALTAEDE